MLNIYQHSTPSIYLILFSHHPLHEQPQEYPNVRMFQANKRRLTTHALKQKKTQHIPLCRIMTMDTETHHIPILNHNQSGKKRTQITNGFGMSENGVVTARNGHFNETNSDELMNHRIYEFVSTDFSRQTIITSRKIRHPHNVAPPSSKLLYFHP